jgi:branched-chain amino acid transport system permease protein
VSRRFDGLAQLLAPVLLVVATAFVGSFPSRAIEIYFLTAIISVAIVVAVVALGVLALLLTRTRIGLQMRAAATDFSTARMLGVRANTVIGVAVLLSALLAAAVAVILTVQNPLVSPDFALKDTIIVLVGVVVGGIDRLWTAMLGGFAIGFATGVINGALPTDKTVFLPSVVFLLVIGVLLVRPDGLFARGRRGLVERL